MKTLTDLQNFLTDDEWLRYVVDDNISRRFDEIVEENNLLNIEVEKLEAKNYLIENEMSALVQELENIHFIFDKTADSFSGLLDQINDIKTTIRELKNSIYKFI